MTKFPREHSLGGFALYGPTLTILIPVFNERATISELLDRVVTDGAPERTRQIIAVDDCSTDGSDEVLRSWQQAHPEIDLEIYRHETNAGKGLAIRTGLAHARGEVTIIQDADLEYDPADYEAVISPIMNGDAEVVYGSRYLRKENHLPWTPNRVCVHLLNVMVRVLYGQKITDEATCYKAFRTDLLKRLDLRCRRFEFCPEVTAKVCRLGIPIVEVPIRYEPRTKSEGKKIGWRDGIGAISELMRWRLKRKHEHNITDHRHVGAEVGIAKNGLLAPTWSRMIPIIVCGFVIYFVAIYWNYERDSLLAVPTDHFRQSVTLSPVLLEADQTVSHSFVFHNRSQHLVELNTPSRNCVCSRIYVDKLRLLPGDSARLFLTVKLNNSFEGAREITTSIEAKTGETWYFTLRIPVIRPVVAPTQILICPLNEANVSTGPQETYFQIAIRARTSPELNARDLRLFSSDGNLTIEYRRKQDDSIMSVGENSFVSRRYFVKVVQTTSSRVDSSITWEAVGRTGEIHIAGYSDTPVTTNPKRIILRNRDVQKVYIQLTFPDHKYTAKLLELPQIATAVEINEELTIHSPGVEVLINTDSVNGLVEDIIFQVFRSQIPCYTVKSRIVYIPEST
jgi:dolichol-phosphate mannosyltransferase